MCLYAVYCNNCLITDKSETKLPEWPERPSLEAVPVCFPPSELTRRVPRLNLGTPRTQALPLIDRMFFALDRYLLIFFARTQAIGRARWGHQVPGSNGCIRRGNLEWWWAWNATRRREDPLHH